jgi:4-hydroxybenzoate polyprenyltransferase
MQPVAQSAAERPSAWKKFALTLEMIKFEHSVFALPFALTGAMLAWRETGFPTERLSWKLAWIVVAMVAARSAAMAFNRVLDADIDARNPRTATRHLPAGLLSRGFAWGFILISSLVFLGAAGALNPLCLLLSPVALGVVLFYSWTKRFTALSHLVLGFALGIAPAAAWIAMTGTLDGRILWLTAAVTLWTAGFDVIYSCQDFDFDRTAGLFSIPRKLGIRRALVVSRAMHAGMISCLAMLALAMGSGWLGWVAIGVVALMLVYEHRLVRHDDFSKVNAAFFTMNGFVSVVFFVFWAADILMQRRGA